MNTTPIVILALIYLIIAIAWWCSKTVKRFSHNLEPLLNLFNIIAALAVFVQLYYTIDQFHIERQIERDQDIATFVAKLDSLEAEIAGNLGVCQGILEHRNEHVTGATSPHRFFATTVLEAMMKDGFITDSTLRIPLSNLYHRMLVANDLVRNLQQLLYLETISPPNEQTAKMINDRLVEGNTYLLQQAEEIGGQLRAVTTHLPNFRETKLKLLER